MNYYETMYIVHPAIESGRLKDLILSVEKNMNSLGGKTCAINVWGKKKLAYAINKEKYGMYILFQFKNDGKSNKDFNLGLDHNANILAYLTTKIDENNVLNDLPDLDTQLGLSSSNNENDSKLQNQNTKTEETDNSTDEAQDVKSDAKSDDKIEEQEAE